MISPQVPGSSIGRALLVVLVLVACRAAPAQESTTATFTTKDGKTVVITKGGTVQAKSSEEPAAKPTKEGKSAEEGSKKSPDDKDKGNDEKGKDKKEQGKDDANVIKRPIKSDKPAMPIGDEVSLSKEGKVSFDMKEQPWETVLQWLADSSKLSFDWQELPGDTLNLTTTREYTLDEARDILNRHLLARGFCIILNGELLSVLKTADIKPSLVPRVQPEELKDQLDHTICKVSFDLDWLVADEAVEELAPMLTKVGKISKLSRTNRLEVMDTAASLREIYEILQAEQSDTGHEQLVRTFRLENRRASEVIELLRSLLGLENEGGSGGGRGRGSGSMGGMDMGNMMRQMQQQMQQAMQRASSGGGNKSGGGKEPRKTRLVLNQRENMILVTAEPDQMALIEKAIAQIDVPIKASDSILSNINRMKVYRLETVDPQTLVDLLQELGDMSPGTVLKVDEDGKSIMAFANLADHLTITTLVDRLDQSARKVEVIPLRRLDSEYVAGTIRALMGPPPEKQNNNSRYFSRYYGPQPEKEEEKGFKVEPDIENNRLLVYANKMEMDEIMILLQKLGEIPDPDAADNGIRVFELGPNEDPHEVMERIKRLWRRKNELDINIPEKKPDEKESEDKNADNGDSVTSAEFRSRSRIEVWPPPRDKRSAPQIAASHRFSELLEQPDLKTTVSSAVVQSETRDDVPRKKSWSPVDRPKHFQKPSLTVAKDEAAATTAEANQEPPIRFSTTPDGHLIMSSDDKLALQDMEDLMRSVVKPAPKYKVFYLKYATPSWVTINLEEYFENDEESDGGYRYDPWFGFMPSAGKSSGSASLGKRRTPQFIYDTFTSSILVRNADRRQMHTIEELIKIYDVAEPADSRSMRVTKIFKLQHSKAEAVSQAVKDVFRDLLSSNDKALEKKGEEKQQQSRSFSYFGSDSGSDDDTPVRFKGLLSIGVEPNSDTLVVSSAASLMDTLSELIIELDKAGERSSSVQVLKLDPTVDIQLLQEKLSKALGGIGSKPEQQGRPQQNPGQNPNGIPIGAQQSKGR